MNLSIRAGRSHPKTGARSSPLHRLRVACVLGALALVCGLPACEDASKKEAQELDRAVTAYRQAENDRKPELAGAISATPCAAKDVCDARAACSTTAKATGEGLLKKRKVETFLAQELPKLSPGDPKAQEMLDELTAAEALLVKGRDSVAACDDAMLNLRRAHNLR